MTITRTTRAWIYGICLAVGALLVVYGILETNQLAAWLTVAAAILVPNGLALANLGNDAPRRAITKDTE